MSKKETLEEKIKANEEEEVEQEEVEGEEAEEEEIEIKEVFKDKKEKKGNEIQKSSIKRRKSLYAGFDEKQDLFRPEYRFNNEDPLKEKMWALMDTYLKRDVLSIQKSIVQHIEFTLSKTRFDINSQYLFQGTALSVRDRLLEQWNDTQLYIRMNNPKKIYYLSIEFLLGRLLQNALVCLDLESSYKKALDEFGIKLEELYEEENDPALGNGGLGRLVFSDKLFKTMNKRNSLIIGSLKEIHGK